MYQQERTEAVKLRFQGNGYGVIAKNLGVSKTSVSNWCKKLELPVSARKILDKKNQHIKEKFKLYNQQKHEFVQRENKEITDRAIRQVARLSRKELLLIGAALYWAEGYKKETPGRSPSVCFANADPSMVVLFLRFLREVIRVREEKLRPKILLHPNINKGKVIEFWSHITGIPEERFLTTNQISRASQGKRPKDSLPYGTLDLRVHSRKNFFQIKGWIDGLIKQNSR